MEDPSGDAGGCGQRDRAGDDSEKSLTRIATPVERNLVKCRVVSLHTPPTPYASLVESN